MMDLIDIHLGRRLRRRRRILGLTQQQLAGACGVRFQQIQKYECAANRMSAARLWQLAEVLEVPIDVHPSGTLSVPVTLKNSSWADVTILRIVSPGTARPDDGPVADAVRAGAGKLGLRVIERRDAGRAVVEESARGYDLLLIGVGPEWGLEHRSFGLHSEQIITECPTSLLVVRQYEPALAVEPASVTRRRDAISVGA